ncbi:MAG: DUF6318 family protein [Varibaculum sp.]|nr:DUF6318 family protein [Varibaculum sp.]
MGYRHIYRTKLLAVTLTIACLTGIAGCGSDPNQQIRLPKNADTTSAEETADTLKIQPSKYSQNQLVVPGQVYYDRWTNPVPNAPHSRDNDTLDGACEVALYWLQLLPYSMATRDRQQLDAHTLAGSAVAGEVEKLWKQYLDKDVATSGGALKSFVLLTREWEDEKTQRARCEGDAQWDVTEFRNAFGVSETETEKTTRWALVLDYHTGWQVREAVEISLEN